MRVNDYFLYAKTIVPVPVCKSNLIYNGANQTLVAANSDYTMENGIRKNVFHGKLYSKIKLNHLISLFFQNAHCFLIILCLNKNVVRIVC